MIAFSPLQRRNSPSVVVAVIALFAIASFWLRTGLDMYPVDDGWVSLSVTHMKFDFFDFLFTNSRELRNLPYIIAKSIEDDGFRAINLILIGIDALTFVGLFRISLFLLPGRTVASFMVAGLSMLFPNDHTMFWLGAFGVNLSYLFLVWGTVVALAAIDRQRPWLHALGLVLLFCGIRTYPGYIFMPLIMVSGFLLMRQGAAGYLRGFTRHILPQWLTFAVALAPTVQGMVQGRGREGRVAHFDVQDVVAGYREMSANLLWRWMDDLWPQAHWVVAYAVFFALLFTVAIVLLRRTQRPGGQSPMHAFRPFALAAICISIVLLCYLPYAVSDIRFDHGRALIACRFGLVLLMVALVDRWQMQFGRPATAWALCAVGVALLTLFGSNRLSIVDARHERSVYQRVLLADLAVALPCPPADTPIVLIVRQDAFSKEKGGKMLINRPQFLLRALYANDNVKAYTVSNWMLGRHGGIDPSDGTIIYRRRDLGPAPLLLHYSFDSGIKHAAQARFRVGRPYRWTTVHGSPLPASQCHPAPLVRELWRDRGGYLDHLGLPTRKP